MKQPIQARLPVSTVDTRVSCTVETRPDGSSKSGQPLLLTGNRFMPHATLLEISGDHMRFNMGFGPGANGIPGGTGQWWMSWLDDDDNLCEVKCQMIEMIEGVAWIESDYCPPLHTNVCFDLDKEVK